MLSGRHVFSNPHPPTISPSRSHCSSPLVLYNYRALRRCWGKKKVKSESEEDNDNQSGGWKVGVEGAGCGEGKEGEGSGRVGEGGETREGGEGRRRHVCRSMIYRLHCHHGDFCQPHSSIQSGGGGEEGGGELGGVKGGGRRGRWQKSPPSPLTNQPAVSKRWHQQPGRDAFADDELTAEHRWPTDWLTTGCSVWHSLWSAG